MPSGVCLSSCCTSRGGPYSNPGSPRSWRWARCPLLCCWGRGGFMFLIPGEACKPAISGAGILGGKSLACPRQAA